MKVAAEIQAQRYLDHLKNIMENGLKIHPRGEEVREIADLQLTVDMKYPFMMFPARKYSVKYFKEEMKWKLGASQYDESIKQFAKMWGNVQNPDGTFNSNYGQYWFGPQGGLWSVVTELIRDPDSRRAMIPMLAARHMEPWVKDTVCTEGVGFRLRRHNPNAPVQSPLQLDCSVHMRSSDSVFGLGTDIATFTFLYHLVRALVNEGLSGGMLKVGEMTITAMSSHIYSRHYEMVEQMILDGAQSFDETTTMPACSCAAEALRIVSHRGKKPTHIPSVFELEGWLHE